MICICFFDHFIHHSFGCCLMVVIFLFFLAASLFLGLWMDAKCISSSLCITNAVFPGYCGGCLLLKNYPSMYVFNTLLFLVSLQWARYVWRIERERESDRTKSKCEYNFRLLSQPKTNTSFTHFCCQLICNFNLKFICLLFLLILCGFHSYKLIIFHVLLALI